ncbi:MAG: DUF86 domain-containing protein [Rikenellaceae bacterium]|jgi:uncharacterized protein with HEPN domain|nr:DUF86 domain-containing protein [Rikenellaceae bacterium]
MYDKLLIREILERIAESLREVVVWTESVRFADDFASNSGGMILLNAVCMKLIAIGEEVKSLDRKTQGELLPKYGEIEWREVMGLRDIIAHHYFDIDAGEIFSVLSVDIPPLVATIERMTKEL